MNGHYTPLFASIRHSTKLAALPDDACRLFYLLLLAQCDAWGRIDGRPAVLFAEVWPLLGKDAAETERCRNETSKVGLIEICELEGEVWVRVPDWEDKAGTIGKRDHRKASRWPDDGPLWPGLARTGPASSAVARSGPRARARSQPQPQPQPKPQPQPERESEVHPPSGPLTLSREPARKTVNGGNAMTHHWDAEWSRTRPTPWAWQPKDAVALASCAKLAGSSPEEVCRRITRLLDSQDSFHVRSASPGLLLSQWNQLAFDLRPISKGDAQIAEIARQVAQPHRSIFDLSQP